LEPASSRVFVLSSLAAIGQHGHYLEIVLPGMLVGALTGFVTQRYPQFPSPNRAAPVWLFALVAASLSSTVVRTNAQSTAPVDTLEPVARLIGTWTGTSEGQPGKGQVERQYERVLGVEIHPGSKPKYLPAAREESEGRDPRRHRILQFR
jgi:hypothetical protein